MTIKHNFISTIIDNPSLPDMLRPSNWNDAHQIEDNTIQDNHVDFGLAAGQVNTDVIPEGPIKKFTRQFSFFNVILLSNPGPLPLLVGMPVYRVGGFDTQPAKADTAATSVVTGITRDTVIAPANNGLIQQGGRLIAQGSEWAPILEQPGGLVPGDIYYLSAQNAGKITNIPPTTVGEFVVRLGVAKSPTILDVDIFAPIEIV